MDEKTKQEIKKVREKYSNNPEIQYLLDIIGSLEIRLISADIMAMMIDVATRRRGLDGEQLLDERSEIADARLSYGPPWEYEFADRNLLLGYKGGIDEVKDRLKP